MAKIQAHQCDLPDNQTNISQRSNIHLLEAFVFYEIRKSNQIFIN